LTGSQDLWPRVSENAKEPCQVKWRVCLIVWVLPAGRKRSGSAGIRGLGSDFSFLHESSIFRAFYPFARTQRRPSVYNHLVWLLVVLRFCNILLVKQPGMCFDFRITFSKSQIAVARLECLHSIRMPGASRLIGAVEQITEPAHEGKCDLSGANGTAKTGRSWVLKQIPL
jgi:hypothetical protein